MSSKVNFSSEIAFLKIRALRGGYCESAKLGEEKLPLSRSSIRQA